MCPCVFVDDVAADTADPEEEEAESQLSGFLLSVSSRLTPDGLDISSSKSVVTASNPALGRRIVGRLRCFGLSFTNKVKSLRIDFAVGTHRNAAVITHRLKQVRKRQRGSKGFGQLGLTRQKW